MALLKQEEERPREEAERMMETTPISPMGDPIVAAAIGSVIFSWYQFYIKDDTHHALFVGLWAPTLLTAASYMQQKDIVRKIKEGVSSI